MTTLRMMANGVRLRPDVELPEELADVDPALLSLVVLVRSEKKVVSFTCMVCLVGETVEVTPPK